MRIPLVADFGECTSKVGVSIQPEPKVIPSVTASTTNACDTGTGNCEYRQWSSESWLNDSLCRPTNRETLFGDPALQKFWNYSPPPAAVEATGSGRTWNFERPLGSDGGAEAAEAFWMDAFTSGLQVWPENHPLLLCKSPLIRPADLEECVETYFEAFGVPRLDILPQEVMAVHAFCSASPAPSKDLLSVPQAIPPGTDMYNQRPTYRTPPRSVSGGVASFAAPRGTRNLMARSRTSPAPSTAPAPVQRPPAPSPLPAPQDFTGVVVNVGESSTRIVAVAEGFLLDECIIELPLAGRQVTNCLGTLMHSRLRASGALTHSLELDSFGARELWRSVKESVVAVTDDFYEEYFLDKWSRENEPPGATSQLSAAATRKAKKGVSTQSAHSVALNAVRQGNVPVGLAKTFSAECLFRPEILPLMGIQSADVLMSLPEGVDAVIQRSPVDCRRKMYDRICVVGGGSLLKNFAERMQAEVKTIVFDRQSQVAALTGQQPRPVEVRVRRLPAAAASGPLVGRSKRAEPAVAAVWRGAACYANGMSQVQQQGTSREQYLENGSASFHLKNILSRLNGWGLAE